jgi:glycosyltransferase involved in cell wall biosynthesis
MSKPAPFFSVVVPVFNRAGTVGETLETVRAQTFADFECLVVDDGSDDAEALHLVIEGLGDHRFRYVRRPNGGAGAARNTGFDEAKGRFVALLDSDDLWLPGKLEQDGRAATGDDVLFSPMIVERAGRRVGRRPIRGPKPDEDMSEYLACRQGFTPLSTLCLPVDLARRVRFDESVGFGDDTDFAIRLAAAGATFSMLPEAQAMMRDDPVVGRLSQDADWRVVLEWLERVRPLMTERAYQCYRGWHVARLAAGSSRRQAMGFYFAAVSRGAFPIGLAAKALLQILVPRRIYRRADRLRSRKQAR